MVLYIFFISSKFFVIKFYFMNKLNKNNMRYLPKADREYCAYSIYYSHDIGTSIRTLFCLSL